MDMLQEGCAEPLGWEDKLKRSKPLVWRGGTRFSSPGGSSAGASTITTMPHNVPVKSSFPQELLCHGSVVTDLPPALLPPGTAQRLSPAKASTTRLSAGSDSTQSPSDRAHEWAASGRPSTAGPSGIGALCCGLQARDCPVPSGHSPTPHTGAPRTGAQ